MQGLITRGPGSVPTNENRFVREKEYVDAIKTILLDKLSQSNLKGWIGQIKSSFEEKNCSRAKAHEGRTDYPGARFELYNSAGKGISAFIYPSEQYFISGEINIKAFRDAINFDIAMLIFKQQWHEKYPYPASPYPISQSSLMKNYICIKGKNLSIVEQFYDPKTGWINLEAFEKAIQETKEVNPEEKAEICGSLFPKLRDQNSDSILKAPLFINPEELSLQEKKDSLVFHPNQSNKPTEQSSQQNLTASF